MPTTEPKPEKRRFVWCCGDGKGHVVGEIGYKVLDGKKVTVLMHYKTSLREPPSDTPALHGKIATAYELECTICNAKYDWFPSLASLQKLMSHYYSNLDVKHG